MGDGAVELVVEDNGAVEVVFEDNGKLLVVVVVFKIPLEQLLQLAEHCVQIPLFR